MFENGHKDQWISLAEVNQRQIRLSDGNALPERFEVVDIVIKSGVVDPGIGLCTQSWPPVVSTNEASRALLRPVHPLQQAKNCLSALIYLVYNTSKGAGKM